MKIGILACGVPPGILAAEHGSYAGMIQCLLGPGHDYDVFDTMAGELPAPGSHPAYILTGSPAGVYDPLPWIPPLLDFLRATRGQAKIVGICFGHQAMAQAWGGQVEKSTKGWGIGLHRYEARHRAPWMDDTPHIDAPASHQDQVITAPEGARVVLSSPFTPYAGLDYGDAMSVQFHPEFTSPFSRALIQTREDNYGPLTEPALASLDAPDDRARVGEWICHFLSSRKLP